MKKIFTVLTAILMLLLKGMAQPYIQGSIQQGASPNQVNIVFKPNYTSQSGEYVNYLSISIAIPTVSASGVTPSIAMTGPFTGMSMTPGIPFSYTAGTETVYSWVYGSGPSVMSWTNVVEFTGATITLTGGSGTSKLRLIDFTNFSPNGGANSNTYFLVVTNKSPFDVTNYSSMFYSASVGGGSTTGLYGNGDQYVETNVNIAMGACNPSPNAGTVSGTSPLCIGGTATYSSNGDAGGSWSSTNTLVATVNASTGLVTAVSAGTADITYTVNGCSDPASSFKTLTISQNVTAGTVSGTTPLCIGATATYSSNGTAGGTWSSTNTLAATVNASTGLVTAVNAGTTDITYTVSSGCGSPQSSFKVLTVSPNVTAGTVSGTSPLMPGGTATYISNGTAGGSWSSSNTSVATVNASTGLVSAVAAGTSNITYTVSSGCGSPQSAFKTLTVSPSPYIQGSIKQGTNPNSADISFLPNYTSAADEYVNYLSISIAIPTASASGVTPSIAMTGPFTGMSMTPGIPFSYTAGSETIYSWVYGSGPSVMSWTSGTAFTGATISFTGGSGTSKVRLIDFTNFSPSGGANSNTYFLVVTNKSPFDVTNYASMFYSIAGANGSTTGLYGNGDQYVETSANIAMAACNPSPNAGTVSGTSPLCIGGTATYSNNGDAGGSWSSTNALVATVNSNTGLVTTLSGGTTDITYTVNGCSGPVSSFKTLTVSQNVTAGTVNGTSPLCIGATATYSSNGTAGGTWSSTHTLVATVNASTGLVTAVSAGTTDITYTVSSGCGSPVSSSQALIVNPNVTAGTVSGTSPLCIGATATYSSNGTTGGTWSSTNTSAATVNASTGLVTAVSAGTTNITYTVSSGCGSPVSSFQALIVNPNVTAGTVSGTSPLCIGATATYSSNGTAGGTWSSTNTSAATVNASTGLVTAISAGTTDITYTVSSGCGSPVSSFKTLTVSPNVSAGTVSGTSPLNIGATTTYTSNGTSGGTWSSTNISVATVNATTGLVTAVSAGASDITYTVSSGCSSPSSSFKTLTVNPAANAGTVSGTSPLCIGATSTYSSDGDGGGSWSSTNTSVATVNASTGLVTALAAGTTNITYAVSGVSSFKTLTVNPNANAGTVTGTSPLCVGATATYTSNGDAGGTWSSANSGIATVDPGTGLVTAVAAGTTDISYTVNSGCNSPTSSFKTLTVNSGTVSITCPGNITQTTKMCDKTINTADPAYTAGCANIASITWAMSGATTGGSPATGLNFVGRKTFNGGVTIVTYTITDVAANSATCSFMVRIVDETKPTLRCPGNVSKTTTSGCSMNIAISDPVFGDNCSVATVTWTMTGANVDNSPATGINVIGTHIFNVGVTTVVYTVKDSSGNTTTCSFTVTVKEGEDPLITCPSDLSLCKSADNTYTIPQLVASDNCGIASISYTIKGATNRSGSGNDASGIFNVGKSTIKWTVVDLSGNAVNCSITVVVSSIPCIITSTPSVLTRSAKSGGRGEGVFNIKVLPNPTERYFTLNLQSDINDAVEINIYDINGKRLDQLRGAAIQSFHFGEKYIAGVYILEVKQGNRRTTAKLIKQ